MEDFNYRGKKVVFSRISGIVIHSSKWGETHLSASGGGGKVDITDYQGQVHFRPVEVNSQTVTKHEFWIKTEDGLEKSVKLSGHDIPLRPGQKITLIYASSKEGGRRWLTIIVNHNARMHWYVREANNLIDLFDLETFSAIILDLVIFALAAGALVYLSAPVVDGVKKLENASWILSLGLPLAYIGYRLFTMMKRYTNVRSSLDAHLDKLAQEAYQNY